MAETWKASQAGFRGGGSKPTEALFVENGEGIDGDGEAAMEATLAIFGKTPFGIFTNCRGVLMSALVS